MRDHGYSIRCCLPFLLSKAQPKQQVRHFALTIEILSLFSRTQRMNEAGNFTHEFGLVCQADMAAFVVAIQFRSQSTDFGKDVCRGCKIDEITQTFPELDRKSVADGQKWYRITLINYCALCSLST